MEWLNYHHLLYFWLVAREGGLVKAARLLRLSHPTLSAQVHALEDQLGEKLFSKVGRRLTLTEMGRVVYRYAEDIFTLGREMVDTVKGRAGGQALRLRVGIVDVVPKLVVRELLQPALALASAARPVRMLCYENDFATLLSDLASHTLDIVISDSPVPSSSPVRAYNHLLGQTGVSVYGSPSLARTYKRGFPRSLAGAPMLLPLESLTLRRALNPWFERHDIRPHVVAEFADSALLTVFGADGVGLFVAPTVVQAELVAQYGVRCLGHIDEVYERFYAVSIARKLENPAVVAILEAARGKLFSGGRGGHRHRPRPRPTDAGTPAIPG